MLSGYYGLATSGEGAGFATKQTGGKGRGYFRVFYAIHLATAILLAKKIEKDIQFLTADSNLHSAAQKEKLDIGNYIWK